MPEWEEDIELLDAEEIPNEPEYHYDNKNRGNSNLGLYIFLGAVIGAGILKILSDKKDIKSRAEERKKNATGL